MCLWQPVETHKPDTMIVVFTGTKDSSRPASMSAVTVVLIAGAVVELKKMVHSILSRFRSSSRLHKRESLFKTCGSLVSNPDPSLRVEDGYETIVALLQRCLCTFE